MYVWIQIICSLYMSMYTHVQLVGVTCMQVRQTQHSLTKVTIGGKERVHPAVLQLDVYFRYIDCFLCPAMNRSQ